MSKREKIVWRVSAAATGPYRSFQNRAWPSATLGSVDGPVIASIRSATGASYDAQIKELQELIVSVAFWCDNGGGGRTFKWRQMRRRPIGMTAAKLQVAQFFERRTDLIDEAWKGKE